MDGQSAPRERQWRVNGLTLQGLCWGEPGGRPVLALHGWLDNAASFSRLGPLLSGCEVVALDLTGHGHSDRRSDDASYQIWDDLPEILGVVDALGWDQFSLLGHSRGAIICSLFAAAIPERITHLVLLDALAPAPVAEADFPQQLRRALEEKPALLARPDRVVESEARAIASRRAKGLPAYAAQVLSLRNLKKVAGGYSWTTDSRLQGASAAKLTEGQIAAVLSALDMPVLLMLAKRELRDGQASWMEQQARAQVSNLLVEKIDGGHHFHLEDDADSVARRILAFLGMEH